MIVHIITRLEPGGATQNVIDSAIYQSRKQPVTLIAGPCEAAQIHISGFPKSLGYIEIPDLKREISYLKDFKAFLTIFRVLSNLKPEIVHTHTAKAGIVGRWAAWLANLARGSDKAVIIHTPHGHIFYGYFNKLKTRIFTTIEQITAAITDYFIALTEGEKRESVQYGLGPADKWKVIHSGLTFKPLIFESCREESGFGPDAFIITAIGRLEPVKGMEYFIRAAARLRDLAKEVKLQYIIVGEGTLKNNLKELADSIAPGLFTFTGFEKNVFRYLKASNIYVQPSLNEAMGRTVLEAQYAGLPVIVSNVCGLPDIIKPGETGLLVKPGDAADLALAIEKLVKDKTLRVQMGHAAAEWARRTDCIGQLRFSAESMNIQLEDFYREAAAQKKLSKDNR